eukprot:PhF_6_TR41788/c0_g1_i1/m.63406
MISTAPNRRLLDEIARQETEFHATRVKRLLFGFVVCVIWGIVSPSIVSATAVCIAASVLFVTRASSKNRVLRLISQGGLAASSSSSSTSTHPQQGGGTMLDTTSHSSPGRHGSLSGSFSHLTQTNTPDGGGSWNNNSSPLNTSFSSPMGQLPQEQGKTPMGSTISQRSLGHSPLAPPVQVPRTPEDVRRFLAVEGERTAQVQRIASQSTAPFTPGVNTVGRYRVCREDVGAALDTKSGTSASDNLSLDSSTMKLKTWIVMNVLKKSVDNLEKCNRWFASENMSILDTTHPLADSMPQPAQQSSYGNNNNRIIKHDLLSNELKRCSSTHVGYQQSEKNSLKIQMIELRLRLENVLNVEQTFPLGRPLSVTDLLRRRQYIVDRIYNLSEDTTLSTYNPEGGDPYSWKELIHPTDPQIIIHVMCASHPALEPYFRLPHQAMMDTRRDLAIYCGSNGNACYYLRHRPHPGVPEELIRPAVGKDSLFHAIIMMLRIIRDTYGGTVGSVASVLDLNEEGLNKVLS